MVHWLSVRHCPGIVRALHMVLVVGQKNSHGQAQAQLSIVQGTRAHRSLDARGHTAYRVREHGHTGGMWCAGSDWPLRLRDIILNLLYAYRLITEVAPHLRGLELSTGPVSTAVEKLDTKGSACQA